MQRRTFIAIWLTSMTQAATAFAFALRRFAFKIKTKEGGIVGNVVIEASDVEAAKTAIAQDFRTPTGAG